jgi:hypothetical protein
MTQSLLFEKSIDATTAGEVIELLRGDVAREGRRTGGHIGEPWSRCLQRIFDLLPEGDERQQARKELLAIYRQGGWQ